MKIRTLLLGTVFAMTAGMGLALTSAELVTSLQAEGFTRIEIKTGPTQIKVEAIRGTEKRQVIYDAATGTVLKSETETVSADDDTAPGVEISTRRKDFIEGNEGQDDDSSGNPTEESVDGADDDSADDDGPDDDGSDDGSDDNGSDDGGSDDGGSDDGGSDDGGSDDGGSDDGGSDDDSSDDGSDDNGGDRGDDDSDDDSGDDHGGDDDDDDGDDDDDNSGDDGDDD